jgi:UDP-hydrolysing UDP-N-acetyl-D-glucosamine 2-epimerase
MTARRRICVVTGSRAEYGLLYWVLRSLQAAPDVELQVAVTGAHLSAAHGHTVDAIEKDGFPIAARVDLELGDDSPAGIAKSMGLGVAGFGEAFARLAPDILVLIGDRYEILAAAQAAMVANIPMAHIAGGDTSEGAFDEAIRHGITKMAHVHFVTNADAARRVRQLGEDPASVHLVGSPGLDTLVRAELLDRAALEQSLGRKLRARNFLITFHPVTLEPEGSRAQMQALLDALESLGPDVGLFFTRPNADTGGRELAALLDGWVARHPNAAAFDSLGQLRYLSLMRAVDAVVGNSSSGLYEAPSLKKPTVDIGDRQSGRLAAKSVVRCEPTVAAIREAIDAALALDCRDVVNPYGDGHSAERISGVLRSLQNPRGLLKKRFHWVGEPA